jgi:hypothetical protein
MTQTNNGFIVDITGHRIQADSMLGAMKEARIFKVKAEDGFAVFREGCGSYFAARLAKQQVLTLAQELIDFAEKL